jgi:hypothetical protein
VADDVVEAGFCRALAGRECAEPIPGGTQVPLDRLEQDGEGRRVLYFRGVMTVRDAKYFILSFARNAEPATILPTPKVSARAELPASVAAAARETRPGPFADVVNVVVAVDEPVARYNATTFRYIPGPGRVAAKVVDADGADYPGTRLVEVEIVAGPPASNPAPAPTGD